MKFIIKKSGKKGKGVFANRNIKTGKIILNKNYIKTKQVFTKKEFKKLSKEDKNHLDYIGKGKYVVDYSPASIVNHSCNPNSYWKYKNIKNSNLIAIRDIKKNEEITYDYSIDAKDSWKMKCLCKNKNCRKIIYGNYFKLPKSLQKKYWSLMPTWKKRLLK